MDQKNQPVSCEADVEIVERVPEEDDFIVICCDGVFDVNTSEELVKLVVNRIPASASLKKLCEEISDYSCLKVFSTV